MRCVADNSRALHKVCSTRVIGLRFEQTHSTMRTHSRILTVTSTRRCVASAQARTHARARARTQRETECEQARASILTYTRAHARAHHVHAHAHAHTHDHANMDTQIHSIDRYHRAFKQRAGKDGTRGKDGAKEWAPTTCGASPAGNNLTSTLSLGACSFPPCTFEGLSPCLSSHAGNSAQPLFVTTP